MAFIEMLCAVLIALVSPEETKKELQRMEDIEDEV
jgi:hypothetical protein